jgi:hypothetical protein
MKKKSGWYYQSKNNKKTNGVDPEFLEILNNVPGFFRLISEKWIHINGPQSTNPNYLNDTNNARY